MPTATHWYNMAAAKFGVDPTDERAVEDFFVETFKDLTKKERENVIRYLLGHDGSPKIPADCPCSACVKTRARDQKPVVSDPCPRCGAQLLDGAGGGVQCPACPYWFCY